MGWKGNVRALLLACFENAGFHFEINWFCLHMDYLLWKLMIISKTLIPHSMGHILKIVSFTLIICILNLLVFPVCFFDQLAGTLLWRLHQLQWRIQDLEKEGARPLFLVKGGGAPPIFGLNWGVKWTDKLQAKRRGRAPRDPSKSATASHVTTIAAP